LTSTARETSQGQTANWRYCRRMGYQVVSLHNTVMRIKKNPRISKVLQNYIHMDEGRGGGQWARDDNGGRWKGKKRGSRRCEQMKLEKATTENLQGVRQW